MGLDTGKWSFIYLVFYITPSIFVLVILRPIQLEGCRKPVIYTVGQGSVM